MHLIEVWYVFNGCEVKAHYFLIADDITLAQGKRQAGQMARKMKGFKGKKLNYNVIKNFTFVL
jgi:hypothetical protein